jgi:hypothetical protein
MTTYTSWRSYEVTETVTYDDITFDVRIAVFPADRLYEPISIHIGGKDFEPVLRDGVCNVLYNEAWAQYSDADGSRAFDFYKDDLKCLD